MTTAATHTKSTIMPGLRYRDAPAAIDWLCNVLGFARHNVFPNPDGSIAHAELTLNGGMVMLGSQKEDEYGKTFRSPKELNGLETCSIYVIVPDADEVYKSVRASGVTVVRPIEDTHYGSREFSVKDPEGHTWTLGTYDPWTKQE